MIAALDRKLWRDLLRLRGQVVTIALVVAAGIASYVCLRSTWSALESSRARYYDRYRFADVFATLEQAPLAVAERIEAIPGVAVVYPRIVEDVMLPVEGMTEPALGRLISIPAHRDIPLNGLYLRSGRMPEPGREDEVVVIESFAKAHELAPGGRIPAVINGRRRDLLVVGVGLSPEYVFPAQLTDFAPDDRRFAIMWMRHDVLAPAFRMEGAFNDVVLDLQPGAQPAEVLPRLDAVLEPYGGLGAVTAEKQVSNYILDSELTQLRSFATVLPFIFLSVAAFLLNVVLSRLINLQRQQIAVLKALGYGNRRIGLHYLELVSIIVIIGAAAGVVLGTWLGGAMTDLYSNFFRFPTKIYRVDLQVIAVAVLVSLLAAVVGALGAVRGVVRLPPAEAMRPPAPASYRLSLFDRLGLARVFGHSTQMIIRELRRRPWRLILSSLGIAAAIGILVVGRFSWDSFEYMVETVLHEEQRGNLTVSFFNPVPERAVREIVHLPGVLDSEGNRVIPVRFRAGNRYRDSAIFGLADPPRLRRVVDRKANPVALPAEGLGISLKLAEILGVEVGDEVEVEIREGERGTRKLTVAVLVDDAFGLQGYMSTHALHRMLHQEVAISMVHLRVDPSRMEELQKRLKEMPRVAQVSRVDNLMQRMREQSGQTMFAMTVILTLFGSVIAIGVVYNNARVALSLRARDLASLRVLGFTRAEISAILLGELAVQVAISLPLGLALGTWWAHAIMSTIDPETYRMTVIISVQTYAYAIIVAVVSGIVSALLVRRKLDHLDLIGVLKTRE